MHNVIAGGSKSERDAMGPEYSPYIIPLCTAVVVGGIAWLCWLRWHGD